MRIVAASSCVNAILLSAPQGMFIKRHKIQKDDGGGAFRPGDFAIGAAVRMYSRVLTIVDADPFTRRHMAALGSELGDPLPYPPDPTEEYRSAFGRKVAGGYNAASQIHKALARYARALMLCMQSSTHPVAPARPTDRAATPAAIMLSQAHHTRITGGPSSRARCPPERSAARAACRSSWRTPGRSATARLS